MSSISDDDKRFQELNRQLDQKLFATSATLGEVLEKQLKASKKDALEKMEHAINEGNFPAALGYQAQYRWCKFALREY